ncbi:MAG: hypothetical protein IPH49_16165 [Ignavibacteria bacterium]|nr:hypothetical protein [Ignavibacteria bacterium]
MAGIALYGDVQACAQAKEFILNCAWGAGVLGVASRNLTRRFIENIVDEEIDISTRTMVAVSSTFLRQS